MNSILKLCCLLCLSSGLLAAEPTTAKPAVASDNKKSTGGLGINITGNLEAPKVLYILPWKTVEEGAPDPYVSGIIEEVFAPVDPVEFERAVQWHALGQAAATDAAVKQ